MEIPLHMDESFLVTRYALKDIHLDYADSKGAFNLQGYGFFLNWTKNPAQLTVIFYHYLI